MSERELWERYDAIRPRVLGALLSALAGALRHRETMRLPRLPRMADFALLAEAAGRELGWSEGAFLSAYAGNRDDQIGTALDSWIIFPFLRGLVPERGHWAGTATELLQQLTSRAAERAKAKAWPLNARILSGMLRRMAPTLRRIGLVVEFAREKGRTRGKLVRIIDEAERVSNPASAANTASPPAENTGEGRTQADAGTADADAGLWPSEHTETRPECGWNAADAADAETQDCSESVPSEVGDAFEG